MAQGAQAKVEGVEHALDLSRDGVTLFRRIGKAPWAEISHAPLQLGTLGHNLSRLASMARRGEKGLAHIEVWLPFDQVRMQVLDADAPPPSFDALRKLFSEDEGTFAQPLIFDSEVGVGAEGRVIAAVPETVLSETRDFLEPHGFAISKFTTRARLDDMALSPKFAGRAPVVANEPTMPTGLATMTGVGIAGLAVLAIGLRLWPDPSIAQPPQLDVAQVALAPDRGPALDHPLDGTTTAPTLTRAAAPVRTRARLADPATPGEDPDLALALVGTPLPPNPPASLPPALDTDADYQDTIPWAFVPGLDVVAMDEDQAIFTAPLVTLLDPLGASPEALPAPAVEVASLASYVGNGIPAGSLSGTSAADLGVSTDMEADRALRRPGSVLTGSSDDPGFKAARIGSITTALPRFEEDTVFPELDASIPAPSAIEDPGDSIELASLLPTRRITARGVVIHSYAPQEIPPLRPFEPEPRPLAREAEPLEPPEQEVAEPAEPEVSDAPIVVVAVRPEFVGQVPRLVSRAETEADAPDLDAEVAALPAPEEEPEVTIVAALPDVIPPRRPGGDTADVVQDDAVAPVANPDIAALILQSQEDALAPSPLAITRENAPQPRPQAMVRREQERLERLAALAPTENALSRAERPAQRPASLARPVAPAAVPRTNEEAVAARPRTVERPAPTLPTTASVARAATIDNALPLRRLSLIGVYGKSGARHALVRLPNGRFVKVEVGDRVDGYEVAGMDRNSIRIRRRGRESLLVVPK